MTANYKETSVSGSEYVRCPEITVSNAIGAPPIVQFREETVTTLESGRQIIDPAGYIAVAFDPAKTIPLINPQTGEPTGQTASYLDAYVLLYSAYIQAAQERDAVQ